MLKYSGFRHIIVEQHVRIVVKRLASEFKYFATL